MAGACCSKSLVPPGDLEIAVRILLISNKILRFQIKKMTILAYVSLGCLNIINHVTAEYPSRNKRTTVAIVGGYWLLTNLDRLADPPYGCRVILEFVSWNGCYLLSTAFSIQFGIHMCVAVWSHVAPGLSARLADLTRFRVSSFKRCPVIVKEGS